MKLLNISPRVESEEFKKMVDEMMRRTGVTEDKIDKLLGDKDWTLSVRPRGSFTVAMITSKAFPLMLGVSKKCLQDKNDELVGAKFALRRCFTEFHMLTDKKRKEKKENERAEK